MKFVKKAKLTNQQERHFIRRQQMMTTLHRANS